MSTARFNPSLGMFTDMDAGMGPDVPVVVTTADDPVVVPPVDEPVVVPPVDVPVVVTPPFDAA